MELTLIHNSSSIGVVAEVADHVSERQQGLMCRETVPFGSGMLFVFEQPRTLNFWMFNTYQPLDILYLDGERVVVDALRMEPCPRPEDYEDDAWRRACLNAADGYASNGDAKYALELAAGWLDSIGWDLDDLNGLEVSW